MLPQKIKDRYITKRWLGSGAYGDVYEMWDTLLEKSFAVKAVDIRHANKESVLREARCLMDLHHPYIIRFHTCEIFKESLLIFTELLQAESLCDHIQKAPSAIARSFHHYAVKILNTVKYIHDHGIVHGDLKTGNILLTGNNEIKIIDFGLASYVSQSEFRGGTPSYTAPEIWEGGACSVQSDIFSLGCIFYEMIMGRQLFPGNTVEEIKQKIMQSTLTPTTMRSTLVNDHILSTVMKSLHKNPAERIQSCAQYLEELLLQPDEQDILPKQALLSAQYVNPARNRARRLAAKKKMLRARRQKIKAEAPISNKSLNKEKRTLLGLLEQMKHTGEVFFRAEIAPRLGKHVLIAMLNPKGVRSNPIRALLSKIAMETLLERSDVGEELPPVLISNILTGYALGKNSAYLLAKRVENAEEILLQLLQRDDDLILRNVIHGIMALTPTEQIIAAMRDVYQRSHAWYIQEACSQYFQQVERRKK